MVCSYKNANDSGYIISWQEENRERKRTPILGQCPLQKMNKIIIPIIILMISIIFIEKSI